MILYTTGCPKCLVVEHKLKELNLDYDIVTDVAEMQRLGITSLPMMKVNDQLLDFSGIIQYLKGL